jgi:hypothetical protein
MIRRGEAKGKMLNCLVVAVVILAAFSGTVLYAQGNDYPPGPEPKDIRIVDVTPSSIPADGTSETTITARATNGTDASNNYLLKFEIVAQPGDDAYLTTSEWDDWNTGTLVGNTTNINGYAYAKLKAGTTVGQVKIEVYRIKGSDISDTATVTLTELLGKPDLNVTAITLNGGHLFANENNTITATIENTGATAAGAFNVVFVIGDFYKKVEVDNLAANGTKDVTVTCPIGEEAGQPVTIRVTADYDNDIEETDEGNNTKVEIVTVVVKAANAPSVTNATASLPVIPEDTDNNPLWGELTNLSVVVTDASSNIPSVTVNLSSIGGSAAQAMRRGGDNVWYYETNASTGSARFESGSYVPHLLQVNATNDKGYSNTTVSIALTVMKNGDVNKDGDTTYSDAMYLYKWKAKKPGFDTIYESLADVNGDGGVTYSDAMYLYKWKAKKPGFDVLR